MESENWKPTRKIHEFMERISNIENGTVCLVEHELIEVEDEE